MTKILFRITDVLAWLLFAGSMLSAVTAPFILPEHLPLKGEDPTFLRISSEVFVYASSALGFFLLARRKLAGFIFLVISIIVFAIIKPQIYQLFSLLGILVIFGLPWVLGSYVQPINQQRQP